MSVVLHRRCLVLIVAAAACAAGSSAPTGGAMAQGIEEPAKDIIAVQIRRQGYVCDKPLGSQRDLERSKPDEPVWILKCEGRTYRVRLIPNMAADVQRID